MEKCRKKHGEGNYNLIIQDVNKMDFKDFQNPWNFHSLFILENEVVFKWLRSHGLLASELTCHCGKPTKLNKRQRLKDSFSFRCGSGHELSMRKKLVF